MNTAIGNSAWGASRLGGVWGTWLVRFSRKLAVACRRRIQRIGGVPPRRLRLCESLTLGERRLVAVIEFEEQRFLVGATSTSLLLLCKLERDSGTVRPVAECPEEGRL